MTDDEKMTVIEKEIGRQVVKLLTDNRDVIVATMSDVPDGKIKIGFGVDLTCGPVNKITTKMSFAKRTKDKVESVMDPNQPDMFLRDDDETEE